MQSQALLPTGADIQIGLIRRSLRGIEVHCHSPHPGGSCPSCHLNSRRLHGHYGRTVWDGAWQGTAVALVLKVRKFFLRQSPVS